MLGYFARRILLVIPTVLLVVLAVFILLGVFPSSDTGIMINYSDDTGEESSNIFAQFLRYCEHVFLKFDFGMNRTTQKSNMYKIFPRFLEIIKLTGLSLIITLVIGIPAGIISAVYQGKWQDHVLSMATVFISAFPAFCLALAVIIVMALKFHWFHVIYTEPRDYFMPVFALSLSGIATICRMTRSSMLEVLDRQYITALRSLGIKKRSVILKHAFRNALVPIASALSLLIGQLLFSAIVVERFFNLQGGALIGNISDRHSADLISIALILATLMCLINILADVVFLLVNPSIRNSLLGRKGYMRSIRKERVK